MRLGRIELDSIDGPIPRLVSVDVDSGRVIDLVVADRLRLERRGATTTAARAVAHAHFPASMTVAIEQGPALLENAANAVAVAGDDASRPFAELKWLPAADPRVMRDFIAFEQHLLNSSARLGRTVNPLHYERPGYYKGSPSGLIGHDATVTWPAYTEQMDYELELGLVVGRAGHNLTPYEGANHFFGVTIFNDFSARDIQVKEKALAMGPAKAKDFGSALGPWITTVDEVDLNDLTMLARINGEEWSRGSSSQMMWKPAELIAYASMGETVLPGDLIGSGTVGGGCSLELGHRLSPGDVIELEISGIGVLRNTLGQPEPRGWEPEHRKPLAASTVVSAKT